MHKYLNEKDCKLTNARIPLLFNEKKECTGCYACYSICKMKSTGAIEMQKDEEGFDYPVIDLKKCVGCNMCVRICPLKKVKNE